MKTVILCGGEGTRLKELTEEIPKPMIEIGGKPILWHLMKFYQGHGFNDFILCLGYKGEKIREYFKDNDEFNIQFVDTGDKSSKAERIKKIRKYVGDEFFVAYGDDLSDVDIKEVLEKHREKRKIVTLTSIRPEFQYGVINFEGEEAIGFREKPKLDHWINGGFFVFNKKIFNYLDEGELEKECFEKLASERQINVFKHEGFWKSMNTFKDTLDLRKLWEEGKAGWKKWD